MFRSYEMRVHPSTSSKNLNSRPVPSELGDNENIEGRTESTHYLRSEFKTQMISSNPEEFSKGPGTSSFSISSEEPRISDRYLRKVRPKTVTQRNRATDAESLDTNFNGLKNHGSQTDWWLGLENEIHPAFFAYNAESAYNALDKFYDYYQNRHLGRDVVKLKEVKQSLLRPKVVTASRYTNYLRFLAALLIISGIVFSITMWRVAGYTVYLENQFDRRVGTFILVILGTFYPIVIAIYCLYSLYDLEILRPYYMRATMCLILPVIAFIMLASIHARVNENFDNDFYELMHEYESNPFAKEVWDSTQTEYQCCGLSGPDDWKELLINPSSCCRKTLPDFCNPESDVWTVGCSDKLENVHDWALVTLEILIIIQFTAEATTVYLARSIHDIVRHKLTFKDSVLKILFGSFSSLCESTKINRMDPRQLIRFPWVDDDSENEQSKGSESESELESSEESV